MRVTLDHAAGHELWIVDELVRARDAGARHVGTGRAERGQHLVARPLSHPRPDDAVQLLPSRGARAVVPEALVGGERRHPHGAAHAAEELVARRADDDPAVARLERVVRCAEGMLVADAFGRDAKARRDRRPRIGDREDRILIGEVEHPRAAGALAFEKRRDDTEGEEQAADEVGERSAGAHRRPVGEPGHREQAPRRLGDDVVGDLSGARPGRAEPRERGDHEARVAALQNVGTEPFRGHPTGAEVLDHRVRAVDEPQEDLAPLRMADVERDRALAAIHVLERERRVPLGRGAVAIVVAGTRPLDLDDVRAEIGEHRRREGPRDHPGQVEDAQAFEHAAGHGRAC